VCRSAEYNYTSFDCHLSEHDRRTADDGVGLVDAQGTDFFENLCVKGKANTCISSVVNIFVSISKSDKPLISIDS